MPEFCIKNRPYKPGLYWIKYTLPRPITWQQAEIVHESALPSMAEKGVYIGAFLNTQGQPIWGPGLNAAISQGKAVLGKDVSFVPGRGYPFGNRAAGTVQTIAYYALVTKKDTLPAGAVPPMRKTCFDAKTQTLLYEEDSTGRIFQYNTRTSSLTPPSSGDIGLADYNAPYSSDDYGWGDMEPSDYGEFDLDLMNGDVYDAYALMPVRSTQYPHPVVGTQPLAIAPIVVAGITALAYFGFYSLWPNQATAPTATVQGVPTPPGWLERTANEVKKMIYSAGLAFFGIIVAPFAFRALVEILESSQEKSYEGRD